MRRRYEPGGFDLRVKRSKTGLGLFAGELIPKNACIIEYVGREVSEDEKYSSNSKYLFEINSRKTIDGTQRSNTARYINHSCIPNAEPMIHKARVFIFSRRAIKPGEEITYDYGKEYFNDFFNGSKGCACPKCEKKRATKKA